MSGHGSVWQHTPSNGRARTMAVFPYFSWATSSNNSQYLRGSDLEYPVMVPYGNRRRATDELEQWRCFPGSGIRREMGLIRTRHDRNGVKCQRYGDVKSLTEVPCRPDRDQRKYTDRHVTDSRNFSISRVRLDESELGRNAERLTISVISVNA
ncbi:hypothetical protein ACJJTC_004498 [Scirpophaga incertulas]